VPIHAGLSDALEIDQPTQLRLLREIADVLDEIEANPHVLEMMRAEVVARKLTAHLLPGPVPPAPVDRPDPAER